MRDRYRAPRKTGRLLSRRRARRQSARQSGPDPRCTAARRSRSRPPPRVPIPPSARPIRRWHELAPYKARGMASWYGKRYHGQPTASGEIYDMYAMTAAHPTLADPQLCAGHQPAQRQSGDRAHQRPRSVSWRPPDRPVLRRSLQARIIGSGSDLVEVESIIPRSAAAAPARGRRTRERAVAGARRSRHPEPSARGRAGTEGRLCAAGAFSMRPNARELSGSRAGRAELARRCDRAVRARWAVSRACRAYADRGRPTQVAARIEQTLDLRPVVITR